MNTQTIIIVALALVVVGVGLAKGLQFRRSFIVPEGYAGLLYHKGKLVQTLGAGRYIRWGRHFTLNAADLRKSFLNIAGGPWSLDLGRCGSSPDLDSTQR